MPMPRARGGVNGVAANGCFFVWGGEGQDIGEPNDVYPDHDVYNPRTNTWTPLLPLPTPDPRRHRRRLRRRPHLHARRRPPVRRLQRQQHLPGLPPRHELRINMAI